MEASGAGHPQPALDTEIWRKKQKKILGYFTRGKPCPSHPTQPHAASLIWAINSGPNNGKTVQRWTWCLQRENLGTCWYESWCLGLLGWKGRLPRWFWACPGDCPGTKEKDHWSFSGLNSPTVLRFSTKPFLTAASLSKSKEKLRFGTNYSGILLFHPSLGKETFAAVVSTGCDLLGRI